MKPKASTLFHFTKSVDFLRGILSNGFYPRFCLEDVRWIAIPDEDFIAYPMVCFCDIPLSRITDHTAFYGAYGIGMQKDWGLRNKLAPVIYAPPDSTVTNVLDYLFSIDLPEGEKLKEAKEKHNQALYNSMSLIKPLSGRMLVGSEAVEKDFYQESEWRHVPSGIDLISRRNFEEERDSANHRMHARALRFTPADVKYIFVAHEHEIPAMVDFIMTNLGHYPHNDVKLLTTRLVSLESVSVDV